jgi:hypothetical protein
MKFFIFLLIILLLLPILLFFTNGDTLDFFQHEKEIENPGSEIIDGSEFLLIKDGYYKNKTENINENGEIIPFTIKLKIVESRIALININSADNNVDNFNNFLKDNLIGKKATAINVTINESEYEMYYYNFFNYYTSLVEDSNLP